MAVYYGCYRSVTDTTFCINNLISVIKFTCAIIVLFISGVCPCRLVPPSPLGVTVYGDVLGHGSGKHLVESTCRNKCISCNTTGGSAPLDVVPPGSCRQGGAII